jgi:putative acetyltransferase
MTIIRSAKREDAKAIAEVHLRAFPTDAEARLVALLHKRGKATISLVAEEAGRILGHVLFSPAMIERAGRPTISGLGLAPVAVLPEFQRRGIGSGLMTAGLEDCRRRGTDFVVLIGHPDYYPRFGFEPAGPLGLTCEFGSGDAFQIIVENKGLLPRADGVVRYADEFYELFPPA